MIVVAVLGRKKGVGGSTPMTCQEGICDTTLGHLGLAVYDTGHDFRVR